MVYIFDSSSFIVLGHYFPDRFPSFWDQLNTYVATDRVLSVKEVYNELASKGSKPHLDEWLKKNKKIFLTPTEDEMLAVSKVFRVSAFQSMVRQKQLLQGTPVADPFVIASAMVRKESCVVTEESKKEHASRIPNVCDHFHIDCTSLEGFMEREGW